MTELIAGAVGVIVIALGLTAILALVIFAGHRTPDGDEQGPMPRNHGGFGSGPSRSGHK